MKMFKLILLIMLVLMLCSCSIKATQCNHTLHINAKYYDSLQQSEKSKMKLVYGCARACMDITTDFTIEECQKLISGGLCNEEDNQEED